MPTVGEPLRIAIEFSESIDPEATNSRTFRLIEAGPNGTLGDADDSIVNKNTQFTDRDRRVRLTTESLPAGNYRIEINAATVFDRAGNPLGDSIVTSDFTIGQDTTPPTIVEFIPGPGEVLFEGETNNVAIRFSEAIDQSVVAETFRIVEAGANGTFGDDDDLVLNTSLNFLEGSTHVEIVATALPVGHYNLEVNEATVFDLSGNALGDALVRFEFLVFAASA